MSGGRVGAGHVIVEEKAGVVIRAAAATSTNATPALPSAPGLMLVRKGVWDEGVCGFGLVDHRAVAARDGAGTKRRK